MPAMPRARRPRYIDELVVKRLLDVRDKLRLAVHNCYVLDIYSHLPHPMAITLSDRRGDVALERFEECRGDTCHQRDWCPANA